MVDHILVDIGLVFKFEIVVNVIIKLVDDVLGFSSFSFYLVAKIMSTVMISNKLDH